MSVINTEQADSRRNKSCFRQKQKEYQKHCYKQQFRKGSYGITRLAPSIYYCHSEFSLILATLCAYTLCSIDLKSTHSRRYVQVANSSSNSYRTLYKESVSSVTFRPYTGSWVSGRTSHRTVCLHC
jgi:hypothetical protein